MRASPVPNIKNETLTVTEMKLRLRCLIELRARENMDSGRFSSYRLPVANDFCVRPSPE